jgi:inner membrane transporter RhtA
VRGLVVLAVPDRAAAEAVSAPPGAPARGLPLVDHVPPAGLVLGAIVSVQFGAAIAITLFDEVGPLGTNLLRLAFSALILMVAWRPRVRGRSAADLRLVALFGLVIGAMNVLFYQSLERLPLGIAITLEFVGPLGVAVAGSRRRLDLLWVGLAAIAIALLADPSGAADLDPVGIVLALAAGGTWAAYIVLAARTGRRFEGSDAVALAMVVGALVPLAPGIVQAGGALLDPRMLGLGAAVALLSSAIPYSLETEALRRMPSHVFGVLLSLEPAVGALAGFLVLGQRLHAQEMVAVGLVVVAAAGSTRAARVDRLDA